MLSPIVLPKLTTVFNSSRSLISTLALTLVLINVSNGQGIKTSKSNTTDTVASRFEIGVNGGISFNQFTKGQPHASQNTGYTAGLSIHYKLYKNFSIQLEANALQQGGRLIQYIDLTWMGLPESFQTKNVTNSSYALNSIDIPVLINYTLNLKQNWKPSLYIGGSYSYTYNVTENYQKTGDLLPGEGIISTVSSSRNSTSRFNTNRANLIVGANVKLPLSNKLQFLIDMRYMNGLTPAIEKYSYMDKIGFGTDLRTNSFLSKIGIIYSL